MVYLYANSIPDNNLNGSYNAMRLGLFPTAPILFAAFAKTLDTGSRLCGNEKKSLGL